MKTLKWREFEAKPKPEAKRGETDSEELDCGMDWLDGRNKISLGKDFISIPGKGRSRKDLRNLDKIVSWKVKVLWESNNKRMTQ